MFTLSFEGPCPSSNSPRLKITPRRQQILHPRRRFPRSDRRIPPRKPPRKLLPNPSLLLCHLRCIAQLPLFQLRRQCNRRRNRSHRRRLHQIRHRRHHPRRIQHPLRPQTVRRQPPMQRTAREPIKIREILPRNRPQPVQIKMSISRLQRIKRPNNQTNSPPQRLFALKKFQSSPYASVAILRKHTRHVRMQKHESIRKSHNRQREPNHPLAVERPQHLPPGLRCHHKQSSRLDLNILFRPNFLLQRHAPVKFRNAFAFSNSDRPAHRLLRAPADFPASPFSEIFAASQNPSICSRGTSASAFPRSAANFSISRNRAENFAFAFFNAISGSTCKNRATFTAANNKSPISSSTHSESFAPTASRTSPASSFIFSITPSTLSQSNPIRAAQIGR